MSSVTTSTPPCHMTIAEYLRFEEQSPDKHEYRDGQIIDMSGGTLNHSGIAMQMGRSLLDQVEGDGCRVFGSDLSIRPSKQARYYYPDLSVVCGPPEFDADAGERTILNPLVVIEVLSESTQARDRGEKFDAYRQISAMREYLVVAQAEPRIDGYYRQDNGTWLFNPASGLEATFRFHSVPAQIRLADIYAGVTFPSPPPEPSATDPVAPSQPPV